MFQLIILSKQKVIKQIRRKINFSKTTSLKTIFRLCLFLFLIALPRNSLLAKPFEFLKTYAQSITVGIETPASGGSGFLIGKKKDEYFFLTAGHVAISDPSKEEYWVYSLSNGEAKKYRVNKFIKPKEFEGKDIVIGSFKSKAVEPLLDRLFDCSRIFLPSAETIISAPLTLLNLSPDLI